MPSLVEQSRHLDHVLAHKRRVQYVVILRTAQRGKAWNIWDFEHRLPSPFGPEPWNGFSTKAAAVLWIQKQNATDYMQKFSVVKR
jgi:hypothetical protein